MKVSKKQNFVNIISNILALIVQFAINFFVVPKIIKNLGTEAIGYVNLSTDIVSYFSIITIIFNSVAGRFITLEINNDNYKKASEYINSVLMANAVICSAIALFGAIFIPFVDRFLNISPNYLGEVKITFIITWFSSIISIMTSVFTVGTFAKNKLNVNAYRNIRTNGTSMKRRHQIRYGVLRRRKCFIAVPSPGQMTAQGRPQYSIFHMTWMSSGVSVRPTCVPGAE